MFSLFVLAVCSFGLALLLTPLVREWAIRAGWVDHPDGDRRLHSGPVARAGGIAVVAAFLGALGVLMLFPLKGGGVLRDGWPTAIHILPGFGLIFLVGLLDDIFELRPWQKLLGQIAAAGLAAWGGVRLEAVYALELDPAVSVAAAMVWLVGCSNAFNLIDGMDGLAAGAGAFATLTILIGALMQDDFGLALVAMSLLGAILGFLRFNFDPASIFLGDSGSLVIGFTLGCMGLLWSQKSATVLGMTAPIMALALPLADTTVSIGRRFIRHEPIFGGDRDHIHHRLLRSGLAPRRVVLVLYGVCALAAAFSLLGAVVQSGELKGLILLAFCVTAAVGVNRLGYQEFGVAARLLLNGSFQKLVRGELHLRRLREELGRANDAEEHWLAVRDAAARLGFDAVEMVADGWSKSARFHPEDENRTVWRLEIEADGGATIRLERAYAAGPLPAPAEALARILGRPAARLKRLGNDRVPESVNCD